MSELLIIRHGQASFAGQGSYDVLSPIGQEQARLLGARFRERNVAIDVWLSGTLDRQMRSAEIAMEESHATPLLTDPRFNEHDTFTIIRAQAEAIVAEDPLYAEAIENMFADRRALARVLQTGLSRWASGDHEIAGVERFAEYRDRVAGAIHAVMQAEGRGRRIAIVTSGGPVGLSMQMALGLSDTAAILLGTNVRNMSVTTYRFREDSMTLLEFNNVAHLEDARDPRLVTFL
ncbi:phosphoglycerate mutase family protein [bacterium]|nr:phosphoglycerate mutase family protein [bacterium]